MPSALALGLALALAVLSGAHTAVALGQRPAAATEILARPSLRQDHLRSPRRPSTKAQRAAFHSTPTRAGGLGSSVGHSETRSSEAALKSASIPFAEFDTQYALGTVNTSFTFLAACEIPGAPNGQRLLAQSYTYGFQPDYTRVLVTVVDASGAVTELGSHLLADRDIAAECVAGAVVFWTDQQLYAVNSTGAIVAFAFQPMAFVTEGSMLYVTLPSNVDYNVMYLAGFHARRGLLFNVTVPIVFLLAAQPVVAAVADGGIPDAVWVGGSFVANGTIVDGATGAFIANTTNPPAKSFVLTRSAIIAVAAPPENEGGFPASPTTGALALSWSTGEVLWQSGAMATANLFALPDPDLVMSLTANEAPTPCNFVVTNARTGATTASANVTCDASQGVYFAAVPGAPHLASVAVVSSEGRKEGGNGVMDLLVLDATTAVAVIKITTLAPADACNGFGCSPHVARLMTLCGGDTLVVGQTFPSGDGLNQPTRVATYSYPSGAPIAASKRVFANSPLAVTCGGNNGTGYVSIVAPEAVVSVSAAPLSPPSAQPPSSDGEVLTTPVSAPPPPTPVVKIDFLWSAFQHDGLPLRTAAMAASGSVVVLFDNVSALSGADGSTLWTAAVPCSRYAENPQLAIDEANGLAWLLCPSSVTALCLATGAVAHMSSDEEQPSSTLVFAPDLVAFAPRRSRSDVGAIAILTRAADGPWSVASSVNATIPFQSPVSILVKQDSGLVVGFFANHGLLWNVPTTLAAVNITTGRLQWAITDMVIVAMPCSGVVGSGVIVVIGAAPGPDGSTLAHVFGLDPATGGIVWNATLADYVDAEVDTAYLPFWTTCSADGSSVYVGTAPAVMRIDIPAGGGEGSLPKMSWTLLDDRYFLPRTGTTFSFQRSLWHDSGRDALWITGGGVVVSVNQGAWVLSPATGAKRGSVAASATGTKPLTKTFIGVHGVPNAALSAGTSAVTAVAVGASPAAGSPVGTSRVGLLSQPPYTWAGASATGPTASRATLLGDGHISVFNVSASVPSHQP